MQFPDWSSFHWCEFHGIGSSVVEFSLAMWETWVQFPVNATLFLTTSFCFVSGNGLKYRMNFYIVIEGVPVQALSKVFMVEEVPVQALG